MGTDLVKFRFLIFSGQFLTLGNRTPDPSEAEKLVGLGKKKKKKNHTNTSRRTVFRADQKPIFIDFGDRV